MTEPHASMQVCVLLRRAHKAQLLEPRQQQRAGLSSTFRPTAHFLLFFGAPSTCPNAPEIALLVPKVRILVWQVVEGAQVQVADLHHPCQALQWLGRRLALACMGTAQSCCIFFLKSACISGFGLLLALNCR